MRFVFTIATLTLAVLAAPPAQAGPPKGFIVHKAAKSLPDIGFQDGDGNPLSLSAFRGKALLVNVWATWCPPCRHEMPTLDRLQGRLGSKDFEVVALSIDRAGPEKVRRFFDEIEVAHLALYIDSTGKAARDLKVIGLPVTILVDAQGRELGRLVGPAEWDTPEMIGFFQETISGNSGLASREHKQ